MSSYLGLGLLFFFPLLASGVRAQESAPVLTVPDAIQMALANNRALKVTHYSKGIARANVTAAWGVFDPALQVQRVGGNAPQFLGAGSFQIDQYRNDTYVAQVAGTSPWGLTYTVGENAINQRDELSGYASHFQTFGGFQLDQPLLRGFGFGANLVTVRVAKANRSISDWSYRQSAIDTVTQVLVAYSNLKLAHDQLAIAERSKGAAQSLLSENEKNAKIGTLAQSDVITARFQVASQEEGILIAQRAIRDAQDQLRNLIGESEFLDQEPLFVLGTLEAPEVSDEPHRDFQKALLARPDYQAARLGIVIGKANEAEARNELLPRVDVVGGYGYNGFGSTLSASRQGVAHHDSPSYSAGVELTIPFTFASGRGHARAARLQREQAEAYVRQLEADIALDIATAAGQVETTRRRVEADRTAYELAKQALDSEEKKKLAGASSTLAVVQLQGYLAASENALAIAAAGQFQAAANYDHAVGATLERYGIALSAD